MNLIKIGELYRKRRTTLGIRQEDLSEMSGVNMRTIQQVEMGKGNPSFATLEKIAFILGLEILVQVKQTEHG
jgi:transcriptional regulator with XRE-family HTH domain